MMTYKEIREKLQNKKVGIAGVGGLGSNCAVSLVRVGVRRLVLADFDIVDESNLNRQFYFYDQIGMKKVKALADNLYRINPYLELTIFDKKLTPVELLANYSDCDVMIEAFDDSREKQMLIETMQDKFPNMPLIVGSGMAGWGESNDIKITKYDNIYICGDSISEVSEELPPLGPRVGIVANMQANQAIELLLGKMNEYGDNFK